MRIETIVISKIIYYFDIRLIFPMALKTKYFNVVLNLKIKFILRSLRIGD